MTTTTGSRSPGAGARQTGGRSRELHGWVQLPRRRGGVWPPFFLDPKSQCCSAFLSGL
jgi:hypothetical protein